jgi:hypothetical protein
MGKIISMWVVLARREGRFVTEDDAAMWRGFNDWMASRYAPETLATRSKAASPAGVESTAEGSVASPVLCRFVSS